MKFEGTKTFGWENAIIGMRLPMSKDYADAKSKVDSFFYENDTPMTIGENDLKLMKNLVAADSGTFQDGSVKTGSPNSKFLRMIHVQVAITAPLYWWKELDTYKVGTTANSTSTMHKLASNPITENCFEMDDFNNLSKMTFDILEKNISYPVYFDYVLIPVLESLRQKYNETKDMRYWKELIRMLPESWLQTRMFDCDYSTLRNIYCWRNNHKLTEWHQFCDWMQSLPLAQELLVR